jgi:RNA polymerase sigma-70 factor (ECF subfamily)
MAVAAEQMAGFQRVAQTTRAARLATCYRCLGAPLRALLTRQTRSIDDAEDLAQEAFLRLWRIGEWDRIRSLEAFVLKTAANLVKDRSRRTHTRMMLSAVPLSDLTLQDAGSEPDRVMEAVQTLTVLLQVIGRLQAGTREAFVLHRLEDCSHAQIASRMGISISMVEKHVGRAMKALRMAGIECRSA